MPVYVVTNKVSGQEITRYAAPAPVELIDGNDFSLASFEHTSLEEFIADASIKATIWTKLAFERLFTDTEWNAAQTFNANFESYELLTDEQKLKIRRGLNDYKIASEINSTDAGTVTLLNLYETFDVIGAGRAQEILNG